MKKFLQIFLPLLLTSFACRAMQTDVRPTDSLATESASQSAPEAGEPTYTPTPRPTPHPITCADDTCLDACLTRINRALETQPFDPLSEAYAGTGANLNLTNYPVVGGVLGEADDLYVPSDFRTYQEDRAAHQRIWEYLQGLLPPAQMKWIDKFTIFTDGPGNWAAWVSEGRDDDRSNWTLAMDVLDSENPETLTYVLAHELGHLVTMNTDQAPQTDIYLGWYQNEKFCASFASPIGCSNSDSYIYSFYTRFWTDILTEWQNDVDQVRVNSPEEHRALVDAFYEKHPEQFVDYYAATNMYEDMAESFMYFMLNPKPTGKDIGDQKIRFYYDFSEMVALRQQFIQGVCSYVQ